MPYISSERRDLIDQRPVTANFKAQAGDYVYYYYKQMLVNWKLSPCFETAYQIYEDAFFTPVLKITDLSPVLRANTLEYNLIACRQMAYDEFKRRILDPYEDQKLAQNGDVTL